MLRKTDSRRAGGAIGPGLGRHPRFDAVEGDDVASKEDQRAEHVQRATLTGDTDAVAW